VTAVGLLAPSDETFPEKAFSASQIQDQLVYWREHWMEFKAGKSNGVVTEGEIRRARHRWLDELSELRGR
jgi:hypothetical protein